MIPSARSFTISWLAHKPAHWRSDRLKDIVPQIVGGGTPANSKPEYWEDGNIVWLTPTDFSRAGDSVTICDSERKITRVGLNCSAATLLPKNTVIMASRATIGAVRLAARELTTNQGFISFVCDDRRLHHRFLYYVISGFLGDYFAEVAPGTTFSEISRGDAKVEAIAFPPLSEQQQIADYLDASCAAIDAAVSAKRQQLETLRFLRSSIVELAVTRGLNPNIPHTRRDCDWIQALPEHWSLVRIKRVVSRMDYGISVSTESEGKHPVLKMGNIQDGAVIFSKMEFVEDVSEDLLLSNNDLLYNRTNSPDQVGKAALFRGNREAGVTFASYLVRLRVNHRISPEFLNRVVNCGGFLAFARRLAIPSVQQSNLNSTRYGRMVIPLPPLAEQIAICEHLDEKLSELTRLTGTIESQIDTLISYRKSLIHECATGKRRVTELNAERVLAHG